MDVYLEVEEGVNVTIKNICGFKPHETELPCLFETLASSLPCHVIHIL